MSKPDQAKPLQIECGTSIVTHLWQVNLDILAGEPGLQQSTLQLPPGCSFATHSNGEFSIRQVQGRPYTTSCLAKLILPSNLMGELNEIIVTGSQSTHVHILGNGEKFGNKKLKIVSSAGTTALTDGVLADSIRIRGEAAILWGVEAEVLGGDVDRFGYPKRNSIANVAWERPPEHLRTLLPVHY